MAASNPYNNCSNGGLVPHMLGEAYSVVKRVYDSLADILTVSQNLTAVKRAGANAYRGIAEISGPTGVGGIESAISLPAQVDQNAIMDFTVLILGNDDALYSQASGYFTTRIEDRFLKVVLDPAAPAVIENALIRATISYKA